MNLPHDPLFPPHAYTHTPGKSTLPVNAKGFVPGKFSVAAASFTPSAPTGATSTPSLSSLSLSSTAPSASASASSSTGPGPGGISLSAAAFTPKLSSPAFVSAPAFVPSAPTSSSSSSGSAALASKAAAAPFTPTFTPTGNSGGASLVAAAGLSRGSAAFVPGAISGAASGGSAGLAGTSTGTGGVTPVIPHPGALPASASGSSTGSTAAAGTGTGSGSSLPAPFIPASASSASASASASAATAAEWQPDSYRGGAGGAQWDGGYSSNSNGYGQYNPNSNSGAGAGAHYDDEAEDEDGLGGEGDYDDDYYDDEDDPDAMHEYEEDDYDVPAPGTGAGLAEALTMRMSLYGAHAVAAAQQHGHEHGDDDDGDSGADVFGNERNPNALLRASAASAAGVNNNNSGANTGGANGRFPATPTRPGGARGSQWPAALRGRGGATVPSPPHSDRLPTVALPNRPPLPAGMSPAYRADLEYRLAVLALRAQPPGAAALGSNASGGHVRGPGGALEQTPMVVSSVDLDADEEQLREHAAAAAAAAGKSFADATAAGVVVPVGQGPPQTAGPRGGEVPSVRAALSHAAAYSAGAAPGPSLFDPDGPLPESGCWTFTHLWPLPRCPGGSLLAAAQPCFPAPLAPNVPFAPVLGMPTLSYKAQCVDSGRFYLLKRVPGCRRHIGHSKELLRPWLRVQTARTHRSEPMTVAAHPHIVALRNIITTGDFPDQRALCFLYDFHPGAITLAQRYFAHRLAAPQASVPSVTPGAPAVAALATPGGVAAAQAGELLLRGPDAPCPHMLPGGVAVSETFLWSLAVQVLCALRDIHGAGLSAFGMLDPAGSRVLVLPSGRVKLAGLGYVATVTQLDVTRLPAEVGVAMQVGDVRTLGMLLLCLATQSLACLATPASAANALALMSTWCSKELVNFVGMLLSASVTSAPSQQQQQQQQQQQDDGDGSGAQSGDASSSSAGNNSAPPAVTAVATVTVSGILHSITDRVVTELQAQAMMNDVMDHALAREVHTSRLNRLLAKLGYVNERPEFQSNPQWAETGDRYLLKLFRDYLFHQVNGDGTANVDFGLLTDMLNKLDAGADEHIVLANRQETTLMVVTYREVSRCLHAAFEELVGAKGAKLGLEGMLTPEALSGGLYGDTLEWGPLSVRLQQEARAAQAAQEGRAQDLGALMGPPPVAAIGKPTYHHHNHHGGHHGGGYKGKQARYGGGGSGNGHSHGGYGSNAGGAGGAGGYGGSSDAYYQPHQGGMGGMGGGSGGGYHGQGYGGKMGGSGYRGGRGGGGRGGGGAGRGGGMMGGGGRGGGMMGGGMRGGRGGYQM